jgi:predicted RNA-binding protein (virulence factor B family)
MISSVKQNAALSNYDIRKRTDGLLRNFPPMKMNVPDPGSIQKLPIVEILDKAVVLGTESETVVLKTAIAGLEIGQEIEVFTYYDEERNLVATRQIPAIQKGGVGCFRVTNTNVMGAFIDIGSRRDILIPEREQIQTLEKGKMVIVILLEDRVNKRLFATTKLQRHLRNVGVNYKRGDEVEMMIAEKIDAGRRVVVDGKFIGFLFEQEMMDRVRLGEKVKGYVRKCEFGELTVSMQREGMELLEDAKKKILQYLELNGGYVRLNDDTPPEEIKLRLHMSKKTFKKAAGMLFNEGKVTLAKFGIKLGGTPSDERDPNEKPQREAKVKPRIETPDTRPDRKYVARDPRDSEPKPRVLKSVSGANSGRDGDRRSSRGDGDRRHDRASDSSADRERGKKSFSERKFQPRNQDRKSRGSGTRNFSK